MRSRPEEFLIKTKIGARKREWLWHSDEIVDLDFPGGWQIRHDHKRILVFNQAGLKKESFFIETEKFATRDVVRFRLPVIKAQAHSREFVVELKRLRAPRPVYTNNPTLEALHTESPRQICAFYGQRYFLVHYRPVKPTSEIFNLGTKVFTYQKLERGGFEITAQIANVHVSVGGHRTALRPGEPHHFNDVDFFRATIYSDVHWWRFRMVPTPDGQPPLYTDEVEVDVRESVRLQYSAVAFLSIFAAILLSLITYTRMYPPVVKLPPVDVVLKAPKVLPAFKEAKVIPPPPPPKKEIKPPEPPKKEIAKVEPPKPVEKKIEKPKAKKVAAIKKPAVKKPVEKKIIAEKKTPPKKQVEPPKIVAAPPPPKPLPPPPAPAPEPPKVVKEEGPTPAQLLAIKKAQEQAEEQAQALNSLKFLSTSNKRAAADPADYKSATAKFAENAKVGGLATTSNVLDKMASGAPGDSSIKTASSRSISSKVEFAQRKGLNDVEGKVSEGELIAKNGDLGAALGGAKGLEMSGPGSLSEAQIEKALAKYLAKFQYCYEKALLSDSSLGGNLVMQWNIDLSGRSAKAKIVKSQLPNKDLEKCVIKVLSDVPFPKPKGGEVIVKKTFSFSSSSL